MKAFMTLMTVLFSVLPCQTKHQSANMRLDVEVPIVQRVSFFILNKYSNKYRIKS